MKYSLFGNALCFMGAFACAAPLFAENDAVLLHMGDDLQQVRIEARDPETGRWLAIASGYRDKPDPGWLKVALPGRYADAEIRLLGSTESSPFAGRLSPSRSTIPVRYEYPPSPFYYYDLFGGGENPDAEPAAVIEEPDIWAWNGDLLFFYNQYRGLQVVDLNNPGDPECLDYFRYPAKGEDLYTLEDGRVILLGSGNYWTGTKVALQFLDFNGAILSLEDTVELEAGDYIDSRRYGDYLYVMTREWSEGVNPDGGTETTPLIRLYTVSLLPGVADRVVDMQSFQGEGLLDAVLTAQQDGILLSLNRWYENDADWHYRWHSEVHVLVPGADGIPHLQGVAELFGIVQDKFKLNYRNGLLTAVSQLADWSTGQFSRASRLENFQLVDGRFERLGSLDLAPGETLFATRFQNDLVYVVTFLFVDPLFAIDNSDPANPFIAGELEVPGYSDYIEWVDDQLFAVGIEEQKLSVSIFDVGDPTNMSLKDRVYLNDGSWSYSEAQYNDQAISFFPDKKLIMLPFTSWSWTSSEQVQAMQLLSWDDSGLQLRGTIQHLDTPRRGTLLGNSVITFSGREIIVTEISNPDLPVLEGKATLAWKVENVLPYEGYLLQLETNSPDYYEIFDWQYGYQRGNASHPVLYVTSVSEPNILATEYPLEPGQILGALTIDKQLLLLQDVTARTSPYVEPLDNQSLAIRAYDLANPLAPELIGEALLEDVSFLGDSFTGHPLGDGEVLWSSNKSNAYGYIFLDIMPIPLSAQRTLGYIVSSHSDSGVPSFTAHKSFGLIDYLNSSSAWYWEEPLLVASYKQFEEREHPDSNPKYLSKTHLVAVDFSEPASPVELPSVELPTFLEDVKSLPDGVNHYLYFETSKDQVEVWGWDEVMAFKLFSQVLSPSDPEHVTTRSKAWMPPFYIRPRTESLDGVSTSYLDVWLHNTSSNRFDQLDEMVFEDLAFSSNTVMDPYFIQYAGNSICLFEGDATNGAFGFLDQAMLDFPNSYRLRFDGSLIMPNHILIPAGIYGVEDISLDLPPAKEFVTGTILKSSSNWTLLSAESWSRADKSEPDAAGVLDKLNWLYRTDNMQEIDPLATDAGDFWRESSWFGWYAHDPLQPNWIHHAEHGLLFAYPVGSSPDIGLFFNDPHLGNTWTRQDTYPWIYAYNASEWIYYLEPSGLQGRRWFYSLSRGWF